MAEAKTTTRGTPTDSVPRPEATAAEGRQGEAAAAPQAANERSAVAGRACSVAFCPIGMAISAVEGAAPEVLEHLLVAAREFMLAAKAVLDARAADLQGKDAEDEGSTLERIVIS